jgi:hypothetical protein
VDRAPVPFVVGVARSGTTLLRMMLDSHPDVAIPPESHFIPAAARGWKGAREPLATFVDQVTADPHWPDLQLDRELIASTLAEARPADFAGALDVLYGAYAARFGKPRWGDKTPVYLDRMVEIAGWYPRARFVHIVRDGRDVALSVKDQPFGPDTLRRSARHWAKRIGNARRQAEQLPHYLELRYEDLVREPEIQLRRVCEFIELEFAPAMLRYHERAAGRLAEERRDLALPRLGIAISGEERAQIHRHVLSPPDPARIGQWRTLMSPREKRRFARIAGEMLASLGYPLS